MNKEIAVYDNTISAREYISYIAEQAGGFACIGRDGKLYIKRIGQYDMIRIPLKYFQKYEWGEKFRITRIRYEDGIQVFEKGNTTGNTVYINQNNMYIVDQEQIDNIYEKLYGLEVYGFEGESIIDPAIDVGDLLVIGDRCVIYQGNAQYKTKWKASITSKIQSKSKEETTNRTPSQKVINRRVQSQIDQENLRITQLVQETTEHEGRITQVEQDVDGIRQKVENTINYKREIEGVTQIHMTDAGQADILKFVIKGNKTYENNLYPRPNLYPRANLHLNQKGG